MLKPIFSKRLTSSLNQIQKAKDTNKLVVFAGAGISKGSGVPLWGELAEEIKKKIEDPGDNYSNYDPLKLAELLYNELGTKLYNDFIREKLHYGQTSYNELHELILNLNPAHIITTNYDNHFEQVIDKYVLNYSVINKDEDLSYADYPNMLIKMHGDFEELNMVLKEEDYLNYSNNFTLIEGFIKGLFSTHTVLFLGYSFSDFDLKVILTNLRRILGSHISPSYIFFPDSKPRKELKYLEQKGILPITNDLLSFVEVQNAEPRDNNSILTNINNSQGHISPWKQIISKNRKVNSLDRQEETAAFLKFMVDYNDFNFECENYSIFLKINKSIARYSILGIFPKEIICQIYPLSSDTYKAFIKKETLYISNEEFELLWTNLKEDKVLSFNENNFKTISCFDFDDFKAIIKIEKYDEKTLIEIYDCLLNLSKCGITKININKSSKILMFFNLNAISLITQNKNEWYKKYFTLNLKYLYDQIIKNDFYTNIDVSSGTKIQELTEKVHIMKLLGFENEAEVLSNQISILLKKKKDFFSYFIIQLLRTEIKLNGDSYNYSHSIIRMENSKKVDIDKLCEFLSVDADTRTVMRSLKRLSFIEELMDNLISYKKYLEDSISGKDNVFSIENAADSFIVTLIQDIQSLFSISNISYIGQSYFNTILVEILEIYFLMLKHNDKVSTHKRTMYHKAIIFPIIKHMNTDNLFSMITKNNLLPFDTDKTFVKYFVIFIENLLNIIKHKDSKEIMNKLGEKKIFTYLNNTLLIVSISELSKENAMTFSKHLAFLKIDKEKFIYLKMEILDILIAKLKLKYPDISLDIDTTEI